MISTGVCLDYTSSASANFWRAMWRNHAASGESCQVDQLAHLMLAPFCGQLRNGVISFADRQHLVHFIMVSA